MFRLMMILFSMIATVLMGTFVVVLTTMNKATAQPIMMAAALGFLLAIPISWMVAKKITG